MPLRFGSCWQKGLTLRVACTQVRQQLGEPMRWNVTANMENLKMMRRLMFGICVCMVYAAGHAAVAGPEVGPGGVWPALGCNFEKSGVGYDACVFPPMLCPNGSFTDVEVCVAGRSTPGCPGTSQDRVRWTGKHTGLRLGQISCYQMGEVYHTMRCRCTGNIFGWCLGPCAPTGGVADAMVPCPGSVMTLIRCEDGR
jgi:hypothetical protein